MSAEFGQLIEIDRADDIDHGHLARRRRKNGDARCLPAFLMEVDLAVFGAVGFFDADNPLPFRRVKLIAEAIEIGRRPLVVKLELEMSDIDAQQTVDQLFDRGFVGIVRVEKFGGEFQG